VASPRVRPSSGWNNKSRRLAAAGRRCGRATRRTKRDVGVGRTAHGPPGLVDSIVSDDEREGLSEFPELSRTVVIGCLVTTGRVRDVEFRRRFVLRCATQPRDKSPSNEAKRTNWASCTVLLHRSGIGDGRNSHCRLRRPRSRRPTRRRRHSVGDCGARRIDAPEFFDLHQRVASSSTHRGTFGHVRTSCSHVPRFTVRPRSSSTCSRASRNARRYQCRA